MKLKIEFDLDAIPFENLWYEIRVHINGLFNKLEDRYKGEADYGDIVKIQAENPSNLKIGHWEIIDEDGEK
jgi:hypothetical protein